MFRKATDYMDIQYDSSCVEKIGHENRWKCGFPIEEGVLEETVTPTFYATYLYDLIQMANDGITKKSVKDYTQGEREWAVHRKDATTDRMARVKNSEHGFFAINCLFHVLSTQDSQVNELTIGDETFSEAVGEWLEGKKVKAVDDDCGDTMACNTHCPPSATLPIS